MRALAAGLLVVGMFAGAGAAVASDPEVLDESGATLPPPLPPGEQIKAPRGLGADIQAYVTAPARWGTPEWLGFGGALAAVAIAHTFDRQTAAPYLNGSGARSSGSRSGNFDLQDIAPAAALLAGTSVYAFLSQSTAGKRESLAMLEAASFSGVTAFALHYVAGRSRPSETSDPDQWRPGTSGSFPSLHVTVAFAIGTVMAESGGDDYRWLRRVLGYGVGVLTSYERIRHNQHWLSDTVAGAALGMATAHFAMQRRYPGGGGADGPMSQGGWSVQPLSGGLMVSYRTEL